MKKETVREKLYKITSKEPSKILEYANWYIDNEDWLDKSAMIALKILRTLRANSITQKGFAEKIGVSPQFINRIVKGKENLTLETISKIEKALGISLVEIPASSLTYRKLAVSKIQGSYIHPDQWSVDFPYIADTDLLGSIEDIKERKKEIAPEKYQTLTAMLSVYAGLGLIRGKGGDA
nr:helix-turn-helix transcriptional regulator [Bacteroidota bacterium]